MSESLKHCGLDDVGFLSANIKADGRCDTPEIDCPYLKISVLFQCCDELVQVAPATLWRVISVVLWWRRVIEG